jgi:hypothetical protein
MLAESGVFCLGLLDDGQVGIGVLPELKEIAIRIMGSFGFDHNWSQKAAAAAGSRRNLSADCLVLGVNQAVE